MLSQAARQEILRKISAKTAFAFSEDNLTPATRQAITNLAVMQRHLSMVTELLEGENERIEKSALLRIASRLGQDSEKEERVALAKEINTLQREVDSKISEISDRIFKEESARVSGQPPPEHGGTLVIAQLKCPTCGAALPLPTERFTKCQFCGATLSIQEVSSQMKSIIQSI